MITLSASSVIRELTDDTADSKMKRVIMKLDYFRRANGCDKESAGGSYKHSTQLSHWKSCQDYIGAQNLLQTVS